MSQAFTIGNSQRQNFSKINSTNVPGPGTYDSNKQPKTKQPIWGIGTGQKFQWRVNTSPGPGKYDPIYTSESKINQSPSYGLSQRYSEFPETNQFSPPSGTYDPQSSSVYSNPPKFTMGSRTNYQNTQLFKNRSRSPGVGHYETNTSTVKNVPSTIIGTGQRHNFVSRDKTPGVGLYGKIDYKSDSPQPKFNRETRDQKFHVKVSTEGLPLLGPGSYEGKPIEKRDKGYIMSPRLTDTQQKELQRVPGPGTYDQNSNITKNKDPNPIIGTEQRKYLGYIKYMNKLGPGQYNSKTTLSKENSPSAIIGTSQRTDFRINPRNPSPGSYELNNRVKQIPSTIWSQYTEERVNHEFCHKKITKSPSPQHYDIKTNSVSKKDQYTIIGTGQRPNYARSQSPGTGKYNIASKIENNPKFSFGNQVRELKFNKYEDSPGPGYYDIKHTVGDVNKYIITDPSKNKIRII